MMILDPRAMYRIDPDAKPFIRGFRADVLDPEIANTPSQGKYTIASLKTAKGQVFVIKDMAFYVQERTNIGGGVEMYNTITPERVNDYVAFEPFVNKNAPLIIETNQNAASTAAAALAGGTNAQRAHADGVTCVTTTPYKDARDAWQNWLFSFAVPSDGTLTIVFSLMDLNLTAPIPNPFLVGGPAGRRIDFAGVVIAGISMTSQAYAESARLTAESGRL